MKVSQKGLDIIKDFEGCLLHAYKDPATGGEPITIGYGSTFYENGSKVKLGDIITKERASALLELTADNFLQEVCPHVKAQLNQNQVDAITSLMYNIGTGGFIKSTVLLLINKNPNDPAIEQAFLMWNKAAGKVNSTLVNRRKREWELYNTK